MEALWFFQGFLFLVEQKSWQGNSVYNFNVDQWKIVISRRKAHSSHSHPHNFSLTQRALLQLNKSIIFLLRRKIPFEDNGKVYHIQSRAFYSFKNVEEYVNACVQVLLKKRNFLSACSQRASRNYVFPSRTNPKKVTFLKKVTLP